MRLRNTSNIYTNEQVKKIIRFVRPSGISNFDVMIKNSKNNSWGGRAYQNGSGYHSLSSNPFITLRIGKIKMPYTYKPWKPGYLAWKCFTQEEFLIHLLSHELRHLWQFKHPKGYRVWGARGQYSERDADAYAIQKVRQWRRE